jgi:hypothetical protein
MADVGNSDAVSVPAFAVTAAVGAVIILIMLVCNVGKGNKQKSEEGKSVFPLNPQKKVHIDIGSITISFNFI